ncbi:MAG: hypothetical protein ACRC6M_09450 [Microcystaceae cyanobacterium]
MKFSLLVTAIMMIVSVPNFPALAAPPPLRVGRCSQTFVAEVATRLEDGETGLAIAGSGTSIRFTNGIGLVSYDTVAAAEASKPGDTVKLCLVSIPKNCPRGDDRGKVYRATNLRTKKTFTLPDSQHSCGGA